MRVFVAGATGAIGARLVPQLVERGHQVAGASRWAENTHSRWRTLGSSCSMQCETWAPTSR